MSERTCGECVYIGKLDRDLVAICPRLTPIFGGSFFTSEDNMDATACPCFRSEATQETLREAVELLEGELGTGESISATRAFGKILLAALKEVL